MCISNISAEKVKHVKFLDAMIQFTAKHNPTKEKAVTFLVQHLEADVRYSFLYAVLAYLHLLKDISCIFRLECVLTKVALYLGYSMSLIDHDVFSYSEIDNKYIPQ